MLAADHALRDAATAHADAVLRLVDVLKVARAAQWERAPGARLTTPLMVEDPTGETATSGSRLVLRAATIDALRRFEAATTELDAIATSLGLALDRHLKPTSHRTDPDA
ncbi:hypothetical protein J2Y69_001394 [Microbacterium resistens]|uniref:Uncharacterized protein n=1 Tax=Microbacterium resistens TaxID=156977 RepID=A0ABU1SB26_9MICO|nr:hypothetical protein [Microbacterium resistens]MDR6866795.1 hypothetical protein [Microbacterium resistens]